MRGAQAHLQTIRDHRLHLSRPSIVALEFLETKSKPQEISSVDSLFKTPSPNQRSELIFSARALNR